MRVLTTAEDTKGKVIIETPLFWMFTGMSIGFSLDQPKAKFRMKMRANEQNYSRNKLL